MKLITEWLPYNSKRPERPLNNVTSITIHWIGPYPNQSVYSPYYWWRDGSDGMGIAASAHYIVKDDMVLQAVPITQVAWHCGSDGNYTSIGIEVVPASINGDFSSATIDTLRELLKLLPQVPLKRHYDWTGKACPLYYVDEERWEQLKEQLRG